MMPPLGAPPPFMMPPLGASPPMSPFGCGFFSIPMPPTAPLGNLVGNLEGPDEPEARAPRVGASSRRLGGPVPEISSVALTKDDASKFRDNFSGELGKLVVASSPKVVGRLTTKQSTTLKQLQEQFSSMRLALHEFLSEIAVDLLPDQAQDMFMEAPMPVPMPPMPDDFQLQQNPGSWAEENQQAAQPQAPLGTENALEDGPLWIQPQGFAEERFNVPMKRNPVVLGGKSSYWPDDGSFFLFWDKAAQRWQVTHRFEYGDDDKRIVTSDMLQEVMQNVPEGETARSVAYQVDGLKWHEFVNGEWHERLLNFTKPREPSELCIQGFSNQKLDGFYKRADVKVLGMSTYWLPDGSFFLYTELGGNWQVCPRWQPVKDGTPIDLLETAKKGESPGLGMQESDQMWKEWVPSSSQWQEVQINFQEEYSDESTDAGPESAVTSGITAPQGWGFDAVPHHALQQAQQVFNQKKTIAVKEEEKVEEKQKGDEHDTVPVKEEKHGDDLWKKEEERRHEFFENLPSRFEIPPFDAEAACGTPQLWNEAKTFGWGKKSSWYFPKEVEEAKVDIQRFLNFLFLRLGRDGRPLTSLLGSPEVKPDGWFRIPWAAFDAKALPEDSPGEMAFDGKAEWQRAWHGPKLEGLYSIMYHGKLAASRNAERGERLLKNLPGVYVHKDGTMDKVLNYARFVPLCRDGVFWCTKWELQVDRADRIDRSKHGTDQWVQEERSVRLVALWVLGRTHETMEEGFEVQEAWEPALEANPESKRFAEVEQEHHAVQQNDQTENAQVGVSAQAEDQQDEAAKSAPAEEQQHQEVTARAGARFQATGQNADMLNRVLALVHDFGMDTRVEAALRLMAPHLLSDLLEIEQDFREKLQGLATPQDRINKTIWLVCETDPAVKELIEAGFEILNGQRASLA